MKTTSANPLRGSALAVVAACAAWLSAPTPSPAQVGIASVLIDHPGNFANTDGFGAVPDNFAFLSAWFAGC